MSSTTTAGFEVIARNAPVLSRRRTDDPEKRQTLFGDVATINGEFMARTTTINEVRGPVYSYAPWSEDLQQVIGGFGPAFDHAADFKMKREHLERRHGLHTLSHQPSPGEVDRFLSQWPEVGAKLGLTPTVAPAFLFSPGKTQFPKAGPLDARTAFNRHVQGDFGDHGQYDPTPLEPSQFWLIGMPNTPVVVRNRCAVQEGHGLITSRYGDVHAITLLAGDRTETLIYTDFQYGQ